MVEKSGKPTQENDGKDQICSLPESILLHIMSFMEMKDAVKTTLLSKTWRDLWTHTRTLFFDSKNSSPAFIDQSLFIHRDSKIRKLKLSIREFNPEFKSADIHRWISQAMGKQVKELNLTCWGQWMPHSLYTSTSLELLKLSDVYMNVPSAIGLHSLKALFLHKVYMRDNDIRLLLSCCLLLETLSIVGCTGFQCLHVSGPMQQLKYLKIQGHNSSYRVELCAPNLQTLKLSSFIKEVSAADPTTFNIKHLTLDMYNMSIHLLALSSLLRHCHNLEVLVLKLGHSLKTKLNQDGNAREFLESQKPHLCSMLSNLKIIKIYGLLNLNSCNKDKLCYRPLEYLFWRRKTELELLKFFLKNANSLERIVLYPRVKRLPMTNSRSQRRLLHGVEKFLSEAPEKLLAYGRASQHVAISIGKPQVDIVML